jgi:flagellar biosynthetic protein FliR
VTVLLEAFRWAGEILDLQLGLRVGEVFDPVSVQGSSQLGQLYHFTALTIFFVMDGHHWVLAALARSIERVPPGEIAMGAPLMKLLTGALTSSMDIVARAGAAGITALLLADVALAIVARHVPQMNVFLVGIPAKLGVGLLVLAVSAPLLVWAVGALMADVKYFVPAVLGP